jgi:hypothetical protein
VTVNALGERIIQISWQRNLLTKNYVEAGSYLGILPYFLALIALIGRRGDRHGKEAHFYGVTRRYVRFFVLLAFVSINFVFGTPLYALLYRLPFIGQLHSSFRWRAWPCWLAWAPCTSLAAGDGRPARSRRSPERTRSASSVGLSSGVGWLGSSLYCWH